MCRCGCDPCYACGVRPTQLILGGGAPYCDDFNGTYNVYNYGEQLTSGSNIDRGFGYVTGVPGEPSDLCHAWWKRITSSTVTIGGDTWNMIVDYDVTHSGTRVVFGAHALYASLTVGGTLPTINPANYPIPYSSWDGGRSRFAGHANSRRVSAVIAVQYLLIWHNGSGYTKQELTKFRFEAFTASIAYPCRGFSGPLSLSTQQQSPIEHNKGVAWLYIPTDTTELAPCLASTSNGRTVSAVF